jgi:SAF domain
MAGSVSTAQTAGTASRPANDLPAVPARRLTSPSWLDGRLVVGVLLVLLSVVIGAKVVASADRYDQVWAAAHDIAPGTTLSKSDLVVVRVRFHDHGGGYYAASSGSLVGRTTTRPLSAGELISTDAAPARQPAPQRLVTVPVDRLHMPRGDLRGVQVDLYVTVKSSIGTRDVARPQLVLAGVTVAETVTDSALGTSGSGLVLSVPVEFVDTVVQAVESGTLDVVKVPAGATSVAPSPGPFAASVTAATDGSSGAAGS